MPNLNPINWQTYHKDIRFWIVLFFIIRLYGITNPPLDPSTLWRQSDVLMIARNFYEENNNILFPRIDLTSNPEGTITGVEFPIYNYLIYALSLLLGYDHWYGRLVNLIFSSIGIYYFHRLIKKYYSEEIAILGSLLLLASAWFAYSRTTFPDIFGASFCMVALYYGMSYFDHGKRADLLLYFLLSTIGCLSKISAFCILSVLAIPVLSNHYVMKRKIVISIVSIVVLFIISAWYFYWVPYLNSIGKPYFSMGFPISMGITDILREPMKFAKKFYDDPLKYSGSVAILIAFFYAIRKNSIHLLYPPLLVLAAYALIILKSGKWFYINGYYFVMYVPALALLAAIGINSIQKKYKIIFLIIILIENIANQVHVFHVNKSYQFYTQLEPAFDSIGSNPKDLIIAGCDECSAAPIYMSHRKGIILAKDQLLNPDYISQLKSSGFKYILLLKGKHGLDLTLPYPLTIQEKDFCIYTL